MPTHTHYKLLAPDDLTRAFDAELTRLLATGLTQEEETIARRYYSDKERKSMDESSFCGPHRSFPVTSAADVSNAAHLIGKADDPASVKACIVRKAKANGWALPDAWKDDEKEDRTMSGTPTIDRAGTHAPYTGTHSHAHAAFGSQAGDEMHEHEHSHENDADHGHTHEESRAAASGVIQQSERLSMYAPIVRFDVNKWEVEGQATAEVPDSYGTIFGYYPDAWQTWRGNIREQHDAKKAVGRALKVTPVPEARAIDVHLKVSRGAADTWRKVEDNVLTGLSASVIPDPEYGSDPKRWPKKTYNGKEYPYLPRYTVAELSLVDNPACPGCNIQIVRADGFATDILSTEEEETPTEQKPLERKSVQISAANRNKMHTNMSHTLAAFRGQMQTCADAGCEDCQQALARLDPDNDGDIDLLGSYGDTDGDASDVVTSGNDRAIEGVIERTLEQKLSSVYARLQGIAGALARSNAGMQHTDTIETIVSGAVSRALDAERTANESSLSEVRSALAGVKETVDRIAETPVPGAPVLNASGSPRPQDKRTAFDPYARPKSTGSAVADAIAQLSENGQLNTIDRQVDAMAAGLLAAQRRG